MNNYGFNCTIITLSLPALQKCEANRTDNTTFGTSQSTPTTATTTKGERGCIRHRSEQ